MPPRKRYSFLRKQPVYGKSIGGGMEGTIVPVLNRSEKVVHKIFHLPWISQRYYMTGNINYISRLAHSLTEPIRDVQPPKHGKMGLGTVEPKHWEKISFLLSTHSANMASEVKKLGADIPKVFRPVAVKGKSGHFWAIEMSDLRRRGKVLVNGESIQKYGSMPLEIRTRIIERMKALEERIISIGYRYDYRHPKFGSWIVRFDPRTRKYEIFFSDPTNWAYMDR